MSLARHKSEAAADNSDVYVYYDDGGLVSCQWLGHWYRGNLADMEAHLLEHRARGENVDVALAALIADRATHEAVCADERCSFCHGKEAEMDAQAAKAKGGARRYNFPAYPKVQP